MNRSQLAAFRAMPRWQRRLGFYVTLPLFPFLAGWSYFATLFHEIWHAFGFAWIDLRGWFSELCTMWREANR